MTSCTLKRRKTISGCSYFFTTFTSYRIFAQDSLDNATQPLIGLFRHFIVAELLATDYFAESLKYFNTLSSPLDEQLLSISVLKESILSLLPQAACIV